MSQLNAAERRFLENATVIGAQRAIFGKLTSVGVPLRKLGEIAETTSGGTPDRNNSSYYGGQTPWLKSGELTDGLVTKIEETLSDEGLANSNAKVIPKGTLLIALYGATVGKTGILGVAAATNQAVCAVTPKTNEVKTPFLYWFLRHKREDFLQSSFGGAQPNISQRILRETFVPLPSQAVQDSISKFLSAVEQRMRGSRMELPELLPPLAEQRRVVARIEALAAQIHEARTLRHQAAEEAAILIPSGMAGIFKKLGEKYPTYKLETLCDVVRGGSPRPAGSPLYYGGDIPFMKVGDLTKDDGMYLYEASASVNELGREQSRFIEADTLMLTNSGATLGVPKITKIAGCFNDGSQAFLNISPSVSKEFLYYLFKSKTLWFREQLARGQGQPNLNTDMTKQMDVPVPPLAEQRRIVAELDALQAEVDALKRLQAETAAELDALLPAILDRAFKGEM